MFRNDRKCKYICVCMCVCVYVSLQWRHNERDGVSNYQRFCCLFSRLFRRRSKKTSKLCVTGLCEGNPPVTGGFSSQRPSYADFFSIWWRHQVPEKGQSLLSDGIRSALYLNVLHIWSGRNKNHSSNCMCGITDYSRGCISKFRIRRQIFMKNTKTDPYVLWRPP